MYKAFLFILLFIFIGFPVLSDHQYFYKEGTVLAHTENSEIHTDKLKDIPGYKGGNPRQTKYFDTPERISTDATLSQAVSEEGKVLTEIQSKRKHFRIDPTTDPLFIQSNTIISNPHEALKLTVTEESFKQPIKETFKCYESRSVETHKCTIRRFASLKPIEEKKHIINITGHGRREEYQLHGEKAGRFRRSRYFHIPSINAFDLVLRNTDGPAFIQLDSTPPFLEESAKSAMSIKVLEGPFVIDSSYNISHPRPSYNRNHVTGSIEIVYKPKPTEADTIENIDDQCSGLEVRTENGACRYGTETILEGPSTKTLDGLAVIRDWWHKERTYICNYPSKNDCSPLRAKGCYQISSKCSVEREGRCLEDEVTYECITYPSKNPSSKVTGEAPFCLTGDCSTNSWNPNQDMAEVMSKLSLLKEIKKEMYDVRTGRIFHGTPYSCSRHCLNFSDCCGLSSGWGESLSLTRCSEAEKLLSQKRSENKCHEVGTYCAEKKPIIGCIRKKNVFCCFGSKLARIIHEQGRDQIGLGWGSPESPNCRPFTIAELSRIDFNRINFSEIFADVMQRVKVPDTSKILTQFQSDWKDRLPTPTELSKAELPDTQQMKNKVSNRRTEVKPHMPAGSYSLHGNPLPASEREEEEARMVF